MCNLLSYFFLIKLGILSLVILYYFSWSSPRPPYCISSVPCSRSGTTLPTQGPPPPLLCPVLSSIVKIWPPPTSGSALSLPLGDATVSWFPPIHVLLDSISLACFSSTTSKRPAHPRPWGWAFSATSPLHPEIASRPMTLNIIFMLIVTTFIAPASFSLLSFRLLTWHVQSWCLINTLQKNAVSCI